MTERILRGPFYTRAQAARRAGVPVGLLPHRPDLLRHGGEFTEEVYFAFQFDDCGVRPDVGRVVHELKRHYRDLEIADWLVRPNRALNHSRPLECICGPKTVDRVLAAAVKAGPVRDPEPEAPSRAPTTSAPSDGRLSPTVSPERGWRLVARPPRRPDRRHFHPAAT